MKERETSDKIEAGGGFPVLQYWAEKTLSPQGIKLWQTLNHKSACLACAWGTGGQKGGFVNEAGESLQRCLKSVEAITSELMPGIKTDFFQTYHLAQLQSLTSLECDRLGRFSYPVLLKAGESHYQRISWEEVYRLAEQAFRQPSETLASYSSGRSSNEAAYLLQLFFRALGSNNLADCSDLCHAASTVGLKQVFGSGTSMVSLESLKQADCVVLIGSNAPANHPRLMNELIQIRDRGGKIIIINPQIEVGLVKFSSPAFPIKSLLRGGSDISTLYLQPIPGSDPALFVGLQKSLIEQNLVRWDYLESHTENWQSVIDYARQIPWETITKTCGLSREEIEATAALFGNLERVVFAWAMGVTQQENGVDNIISIANIEAAERGKINTLFCLGGNLYGANPDLTQAKKALAQIDTIFYVATKPNLGHFHGLARQNTVILPVFARFENPHPTTTESGNNFVRFNERGSSHLQGSDVDIISEVELLTNIAVKVLGTNPIDWSRLHDTAYIRQLIAKTIPGYQKIGQLDQTQTEFTISGRIFTEPHFPTSTGKAQMSVTPLPTLKAPEKQDFNQPENAPGIALILGTGRSYGQHNTVVYQVGDKYRGMPHRHCLLMNAEDAKKASFQEHQRVTVQGDAGKLENIEIIFGSIREGVGFMFYPEANVLFKAKIDPRCGTPAYKRVPVWVF